MGTNHESANNGRQAKPTVPGVTAIDAPTQHSNQKPPLFARFLRWLYPDQRKTNRHAMPPLVAYLGAVRTSKVFEVGDVSTAGFYMLTKERWLPGTEMPVTLQRTDGEDLPATITLLTKVVRVGTDGVGFSFPMSGAVASENDDPRQGVWAIEEDLKQFLDGLHLSEYEPELERAS
jgi:hypothetical protein